MENINTKYPVVKNDALVYAQYNATQTGMKIIYLAASKIKKSDEALGVFKFNVKDFCNALDISTSGKYDKLKKSCERLIQSYVKINTGRGWKLHPWFNTIEYIEGEGILLVQFHESLAPYLLFVKENIYTKLSLETLLQFKSQYSMRVYELCRQIIKEYKTSGFKEFTVEELRRFFGIEQDEYSKYNDFKRYVLEQAKREINEKSDLDFMYEEEKQARKVVKITFYVDKKQVIQVDSDTIIDELDRQRQQSREEIAQEIEDIYYSKYKTKLDINNLLNYRGLEICRQALISFLQELKYSEYDKPMYSEKITKPSYVYGIIKNKHTQFDY